MLSALSFSLSHTHTRTHVRTHSASFSLVCVRERERGLACNLHISRGGFSDGGLRRGQESGPQTPVQGRNYTFMKGYAPSMLAMGRGHVMYLVIACVSLICCYCWKELLEGVLLAWFKFKVAL